MHRIMVVILAAIILLLVVVLLMQGKKKATMQIQINGLNEQLETLKTASSEKLKGREDILQAANTIYLYATLSEEEARSNSLKGKQAEILWASEQIIQTIQP